MASSGTIGQTLVSVADMVETAARRAGILASRLNPENVSIIKGLMFSILTDLSNRNVNLFTIQRTLIGLGLNQAEYAMPTGTVDVQNAYFRIVTPQTPTTITSSAGGTTSFLDDLNPATVCTQSAPGGNFIFNFGAAVQTNVLGLLFGASGSNTLVLEQSASASGPWSLVRNIGAVTTVAGQWSWYQLEPAANLQYLRLRESGSGTLSFAEVLFSQIYSDIQMARLSRDIFSSLPYKQFNSGQQLQYMYDRQINPNMILWPVPNAQAIFNCMYLYLNTQIQDIGQLTNQLGVPVRWLPAIQWELAKQTLLEVPGADMKRLTMVQGEADKSMGLAESEERDKSEVSLMPRISGYTR